jgi:hypothetical protein
LQGRIKKSRVVNYAERWSSTVNVVRTTHNESVKAAVFTDAEFDTPRIGVWGLTFMGLCIIIIFLYISNKMHMLQSSFYLTTALHVSGITSNHLQEHRTTVTTASGNRYTVLLSAAIVEELGLI